MKLNDFQIFVLYSIKLKAKYTYKPETKVIPIKKQGAMLFSSLLQRLKKGYKNDIDALVMNDLIYVDQSYSNNPGFTRSKQYFLTETGVKAAKNILPSHPAVVKYTQRKVVAVERAGKLWNKAPRNSVTIEKNEFTPVEQCADMFQKKVFTPEFAEVIESKKDELARNDLSKKTRVELLQFICENESEHSYKRDKNGRIYSTFTNMPRKLRNEIGEMWEIDIKSSHWQLLAMAIKGNKFSEHIKMWSDENVGKLQSEAAEIIDIITGEDSFYITLQNYVRNTFANAELFVKNNTKFDSVKDFKALCLRFLACDTHSWFNENDVVSLIATVIFQKFPQIHRLVKGINDKYKATLVNMLMSFESIIINKAIKKVVDLNYGEIVPVFRLHDAVVTLSKENADAIYQILCDLKLIVSVKNNVTAGEYTHNEFMTEEYVPEFVWSDKDILPSPAQSIVLSATINLYVIQNKTFEQFVEWVFLLEDDSVIELKTWIHNAWRKRIDANTYTFQLEQHA